MTDLIIIGVASLLLIFLLWVLFWSPWRHIEPSQKISSIVLAITALVLLWNTFQVDRGTTQALTANLRPVIERDGTLDMSQGEVSLRLMNHSLPTPLFFSAYKNVAHDISGYIVGRNLKYNLLFEPAIVYADGSISCAKKGNPIKKWGYLANSDKISLCSYVEASSTPDTNEEGGIYIQYFDIEGNPYCHKESWNNGYLIPTDNNC